MKKLLFIVSFLSLCCIFKNFSMEERQTAKRKRSDSENITNSNQNQMELEYDKITDATSLCAEINSISSFQNLKDLFFKIDEIDQSTVENITELLRQKYRALLFKVFFNTYPIINTEYGINSVSITKNGKLILFGGERVFNIQNKTADIGLICFDNLNRSLSVNGQIFNPLEIFLKEEGETFLTAISPDENFALTSNSSDDVKLWNIKGLNDVKNISGISDLKSKNRSFDIISDLNPIKDLGNLGGNVIGEIAAISSDNKYALIGNTSDYEEDVLIIIINLENKTKKGIKLDQKNGGVNALVIIDNKYHALAGTNNRSLYMINFENPETPSAKPFILQPINGGITSISISNDSKYALIGSFDNRILLVNLEKLENEEIVDYIYLIHLDNSMPISLCFSPENNHALSIAKNGEITLLDLNSPHSEKQEKFSTILHAENELLKFHESNYIYKIRSQFSSNGTFALIAYANENGLYLACLGNLESLSLKQIALIAALDSLHKNAESKFESILKQILEDQECKDILNEFSEREKALLKKHLNLD